MHDDPAFQLRYSLYLSIITMLSSHQPQSAWWTLYEVQKMHGFELTVDWNLRLDIPNEVEILET